MRVLNIDVPDTLVDRWIDWFSPAVQPFLADAEMGASVVEHSGEVPPHERGAGHVLPLRAPQ